MKFSITRILLLNKFTLFTVLLFHTYYVNKSLWNEKQ